MHASLDIEVDMNETDRLAGCPSQTKVKTVVINADKVGDPELSKPYNKANDTTNCKEESKQQMSTPDRDKILKRAVSNKQTPSPYPPPLYSCYSVRAPNAIILDKHFQMIKDNQTKDGMWQIDVAALTIKKIENDIRISVPSSIKCGNQRDRYVAWSTVLVIYYVKQHYMNEEMDLKEMVERAETALSLLNIHYEDYGSEAARLLS